jgi:hypothetical protein
MTTVGASENILEQFAREHGFGAGGADPSEPLLVETSDHQSRLRLTPEKASDHQSRLRVTPEKSCQACGEPASSVLDSFATLANPPSPRRDFGAVGQAKPNRQTHTVRPE